MVCSYKKLFILIDESLTNGSAGTLFALAPNRARDTAGTPFSGADKEVHNAL
jgi:hypothetical protein